MSIRQEVVARATYYSGFIVASACAVERLRCSSDDDAWIVLLLMTVSDVVQCMEGSGVVR